MTSDSFTFSSCKERPSKNVIIISVVNSIKVEEKVVILTQEIEG